MWPADRVQIALQAMILRENGYECAEAIVFYQKTASVCEFRWMRRWWRRPKMRWRGAWELATYGEIPEPLVDSPKCPGCSLNTICLPDETNRLTHIELGAALQLNLFGQLDDLPVRKEPSSAGFPPLVRQMMTRATT